MNRKLFDAAIVLSWLLVISLITLRVSYQTGPWGLGSSITNVNLIVLFIAGILAGIFLADAKRILVGYIVAIPSSIVISLLYSTLLDWYVYGRSISFSTIPWGFELTAYLALIRIFKAIFPFAVILSFLSVFIGGVLGSLLRFDEALINKLKKLQQ